MNRNSWETFFDAYAPQYMANGYTKNTVTEVDFLEEELNLSFGSTILDVGCGTGRHSIELAKRGYIVTGVDISAGMLLEARKAALKENVKVQWIHNDATKFTPNLQFDAIICLCEGAFGLVDRKEEPIIHDMAILNNISNVLKLNGIFIMTTLNAYSKMRTFTQEDVTSGRFNPVTMTEQFSKECESPEGKQLVDFNERRYFPNELKEMFFQAGLAMEHVWSGGGVDGIWSRQPIELDEVEIMLVARKA